MIIVHVELVPGGFEQQRRSIASLHIANVSDLADVSNYDIHVLEGANPLACTKPRIGSCRVSGHDRRQSVWSLIAKAAEAAMNAEFVEL